MFHTCWVDYSQITWRSRHLICRLRGCDDSKQSVPHPWQICRAWRIGRALNDIKYKFERDKVWIISLVLWAISHRIWSEKNVWYTSNQCLCRLVVTSLKTCMCIFKMPCWAGSIKPMSVLCWEQAVLGDDEWSCFVFMVVSVSQLLHSTCQSLTLNVT